MKDFLSINDLKVLDTEGRLEPRQKSALINFNRYREKILSKTKSDSEFQREFHRLQTMAKLSPYEDFLKEEYY